jgi:hypothetical protein
MALAGKELGKDVGQWFGPSTAAGALKCVNDALFFFSSLILTYLSEHWFIASQKHRSAYLLQSMVRFSRQMYTLPLTHQQVHLFPANTQDGANAQSLF